MKVNWKWPKNSTNNWLPWYSMIWNLLWAPLYYVGRIIACFAGWMVALTSGLGPSFADLWKQSDLWW